MPSHQRIGSDQAAALVLDVLMRAGDGNLTKIEDVGNKTGLTRGNVHKGLTKLREELASINHISFVSALGRSGGVGLTTDNDTAVVYVKLRARIAQVQLHRVRAGTLEAMEQNARGADRAVQARVAIAMQSHDRLVQDLQMVQDVLAD
jgi:hypothetical protein